MNVCMIGHGMMGQWHSETLAELDDCVLHTVVGRRMEPTSGFARLHGYRTASTDVLGALSNPEIDVVIVASPSEQHSAMATAALEHGKHALVEIPLAMSAQEAKAICDLAARKHLRLGTVHPMRMMPDMLELHGRVIRCTEHVRLVSTAFIIKRWENVGATGYRRSWTDNLLWHHLAHFIDFGLWLTASPVTDVRGFIPAPDERTGTPMHAVVSAGTEAGQALSFIGSYAGHDPVFEALVLTDRDCYRIDAIDGTLTTRNRERPLRHEKEDCADVLRDFLAAVREEREPAVTGRNVLPAMDLMQAVQDSWDVVYGNRPVRGRTLQS